MRHVSTPLIRCHTSYKNVELLVLIKYGLDSGPGLSAIGTPRLLGLVVDRASEYHDELVS